MTPVHRPAERLQGALLLGLAAAIAVGFHLAGSMYGHFPQPVGVGFALPTAELAFQALYLAFGVPFLLACGFGLWRTGLAAAASRLAVRVARVPNLPTLLVLLTVAGSLAVRLLVLDRQVITDDEEVYLFIARTLLGGHLVNPVPADAAFFANQFVVINEQGWFGMYPIGHGLVLALGLVTHSLDGVLCLLAGATAALTYRVGRQALGPRRALLGTALLALSPHFVWTHGTLLSQTTTTFALMASLTAWLRWSRTRSLGALALAGLALALAIAARPMPGALFAVGLGVMSLLAWRRGHGSPRELLVLTITAGLGVSLVLITNALQSGSPFRSGYHATYGELGVLGGARGAVAMSVFGGLWRENFWLLGWPLSLLPLLGSRLRPRTALLWMPVVAELVYRVAVPKTVVSTTGPTYLTEMTPVLCLLISDGLLRAALLARRALGRPGSVAAFALASLCAAAVFFVPVQASAAQEGATARARVWRLLEAEGVSRAVVFSEALVELKGGKSWALFAPNNTPSLGDELLFVRWPRAAADPVAAALEFARRRFPDRPAYRFVPANGGQLERLTP